MRRGEIRGGMKAANVSDKFRGFAKICKGHVSNFHGSEGATISHSTCKSRARNTVPKV